uniref:Uncharacterized protein n=1 Tax=Kuenenia stuttgartiensis TaxID=174633 RepID=Q1PVD1_KUEST|nr:unknown protein [Candidatus Kuenenia stuttgartiensis]
MQVKLNDCSVNNISKITLVFFTEQPGIIKNSTVISLENTQKNVFLPGNYFFEYNLVLR